MTEQCNRCRFWHEDMSVRDPNDADGGFGLCRINPPVVSEAMTRALMPALQYGQQEDPELHTTNLVSASMWPATFSRNWCGRFEGRNAVLPL